VYDAVVVGSGPNGLACAIAMAQHGSSVLVIEAQPIAGGGCRTMEITIPGFKHDICSAVYPLGAGSPFFRTLPLNEFGLRWINPDGAYVHALEPGRALVVERSLEATAANIGAAGIPYCEMMSSLLPNWQELCDVLLEPPRLLGYPLPLAKFGRYAMLSARGLANHFLKTVESKAAFSGVAAHCASSLDEPASAAIGLTLSIAAHAVGWPIPEGGAQSITDSLVQYFESLGGEIIVECPVRSLADLPACRFLFLDITPRQFLRMAEDLLSDGEKRRLQRYRYGPACFKIDWAVDAPIPWLSPDFLRAPTVHLAGTFEDIARSERLVWEGHNATAPYVLLAQPTVFDASRSLAGTHIVWAYCHVPFGSDMDVTDHIESQIERFAPGFRKTILARCESGPLRLEHLNANHVGGDINGGTLSWPRLLIRPAPRLIPYKTALPNVFLCSSATPPGSGVHGMCGYYAAWFARQIGTRRRMAISPSDAWRSAAV
jgi:phytoene dehydrogenase-like protein